MLLKKVDSSVVKPFTRNAFWRGEPWPGRLLSLFAVDAHSVTIRLSCGMCWGLALASFTTWAGDPHMDANVESISLCRLPGSSKSTIPSRHPASQAADASRATAPETPEMPRASRNPSGHEQPTMKVTVGARTPALQCLHRLFVSFPSLPTKEESLVTSWAANKCRL